MVTVAGCALFTERETFGKGVLQYCPVLRQRAQVRGRHWHMACLLGEVEPLQREAVVGVGPLSRGLFVSSPRGAGPLPKDPSRGNILLLGLHPLGLSGPWLLVDGTLVSITPTPTTKLGALKHTTNLLQPQHTSKNQDV